MVRFQAESPEIESGVNQLLPSPETLQELTELQWTGMGGEQLLETFYSKQSSQLAIQP